MKQGGVDIAFIRFIVEVVISLVFLMALVLLKWQNAIEERTFLIALVMWGILFPSPNQWAITIGDWLSARKNGGLQVEARKPNKEVEESEEAGGSDETNCSPLSSEANN